MANHGQKRGGMPSTAVRNAVENVRNDFTLRNNFTTSQIQFQQMEKARFISQMKKIGM